MPQRVDRRNFIKALGMTGAAAALPLPALAQDQPTAPPAEPAVATQPEPADAYIHFTAPEAVFVAAAADRIIPRDANGPGAVEAGVVRYIDRQLAGAFGHGHGMYLAGPWADEAMTGQGYQLALAPAELYRLAIADIDRAVRRTNGDKVFTDLAPAQQDAVLQGLERGELALDNVPGKVFFELLLANVVEGYFADPAYGGNRDMAGWKMIGFPGARAEYAAQIVPYRNKPYGALPVTLAGIQ